MACDSRGPLALRAAPDRAAPHAVVGERVVLSWSGGKDCCLALHRAIASGAVPGALLTVFTEDGTRSRSHGLARSVLEAQAAALGVELRTTAASWQDYRAKLVQLLAAAQRDGARAAVFGDIDIDAHRDWELAVARDAGLTGLLPLWGASRRELLDEWWRLGFEARIIVVREGVLSREYLGRVLDAKL
ncbi:MAG TPA: hypothetical protein VEC18_07960, partial [Myxococcota bacterium]|nr:hypothetical protein [Myxococcota bacterium]